jgi:hypothetical protein
VENGTSLDQLPDDEAATGFAKLGQPVIGAGKLGVHVGDGVDAVAPAPVRAGAAGVDALVADPAALHKFLLHQEPAVQLGVQLVRAPHGDVFAVVEGHADRLLQFQVAARLGVELPRVDVQRRRHPTDRLHFAHLARPARDFRRPHDRGPGVRVPRHVGGPLGAEHEDVEPLAGGGVGGDGAAGDIVERREGLGVAGAAGGDADEQGGPHPANDGAVHDSGPVGRAPLCAVVLHRPIAAGSSTEPIRP